MDHEEALKSQAVERYQLGEMPPEERDAFEQHYFSCPECAAAVYAATAFAANARSIFLNAKEAAGRTPARRRWWDWRNPVFAFAAAVLLLVVSFEEFVRIPGLKGRIALLSAPQAFASLALRPVARGDDQALTASRTDAFIGLAVDLPPGAAYGGFVCELRSASGAVLSVPVRAPAAPEEPLNVLIPTDSLKSNHYTLTLWGQDSGRPSAELGSFSFTLKIH